MKIKIADATASQLASYATLVLGLPVDHRMGAKKIAAMIADANPGVDEFEVADEAGPTAPATTPKVGRPRVAPVDPEADVIINIAYEEKPGGADDVFVAPNGNAMLIPRGRDVVVKRKHLEILNHAVQRLAITDENGNITGWRDARLYPFSVVGYPG